MKKVFQTESPVVIYPASGTGAWEAALVNTLSPGDRVLMAETGHFATLWQKMAERLGLAVEFLPGDWRHGVDPGAIEARLAADTAHAIKAVCVVHNETSTGVRQPHRRRAPGDRPRGPSRRCFMVDTISSLASIDYRHDEWGVDVTVGGSQKGLMLPPGLSLQRDQRQGARGVEAREAAALATGTGTRCSRSTPTATSRTRRRPTCCTACARRCEMLLDEGLDNVFARHERLAEATRRAVRAWGLEILCADPAQYSNSLTGVMMPEGHDADALRKVVLERFDMSLGTGLGKVAGQVFRIGHLGHFNDLMLCGTLARRGDGPRARRRAAPQGRRAGGDGSSWRRPPPRRSRRPRNTNTVNNFDNRRITRRTTMKTVRSITGARRHILRCVLVTAICAVAMPAYAQLEIKLGHVGEPGSLFQLSADEFARRANAKLAGKAKVVTFGSSQLGGDKEMLQKVKLGTLDMARRRRS